MVHQSTLERENLIKIHAVICQIWRTQETLLRYCNQGALLVLSRNFLEIILAVSGNGRICRWRQWCEISRRLNVFEGPPSPSIDVFELYLQCICIWRSLLSEFIHAAHPAIVPCCCCCYWSMPHWCPCFQLNHFLKVIINISMMTMTTMMMTIVIKLSQPHTTNRYFQVDI